ncbi:MAG TPA: hypothetical protein VGB97_02765 [Candidatus Paceibacterota bacterium]|jgi:hypothetical protein
MAKAIILISALCLGLAACGDGNGDNSATPNAATEAEPKPMTGNEFRAEYPEAAYQSPENMSVEDRRAYLNNLFADRGGAPWYDQEKLPTDFNGVMADERRFHGAGDKSFRHMADAQTCAAMRSVGLSCDYITRSALAMFLAMNGKDPVPPSGKTNPYCADNPTDTPPHNCFIGRPAQNKLLREGVRRNARLFRDGNLTAEDVRTKWR